MVVTNYARNQISLFVGGSATNFVDYFIIGSGSGTASASDTALAAASDRQAVTSVSYPLNQKVKLQGDWNSVEMSGIQLRQFGVITSGTGITGSVWSKTSLPALTFDGTNELRIEETWEVY